MKDPHVFPDHLTLRDSTVYADEGQRIYTTATGHGYEKCEYIRADLVEPLRAENERLTAERDEVVKNAEIVCNSYADENQRLYDRAQAAEAREAKAVEDMRERAAKVAAAYSDHPNEVVAFVTDEIATLIRALPTEVQNG